MLTEQEALAVLNDRIAKGELREETRKYVQKLNTMDEILKQQRASLAEKQAEIQRLEQEIQRSKGAISILLELAAEEEGLVSAAENPNNSDNTSE